MEQVKQYVVADGLIDLGVKGGTFVRLEDYAALQQKLDAVLAKGMDLAQEAAHVYAEYNKEMAPDVACDGQTIQEFYDLANGWSSVESYLNEVRADAVTALHREQLGWALVTWQYDNFDALKRAALRYGDSELSGVIFMLDRIEEFSAQLRAGSAEGGDE
jgi:hypothetical protein